MHPLGVIDQRVVLGSPLLDARTAPPQSARSAPEVPNYKAEFVVYRRHQADDNRRSGPIGGWGKAMTARPGLTEEEEPEGAL